MLLYGAGLGVGIWLNPLDSAVTVWWESLL